MSTPNENRPKVWHFIPCDRIDRQGGGPYSLTRVRLEIPNPLEQTLPRICPELWLFLVLTDATGKHNFQILQSCLRDQTQIYPWDQFSLDMGNDPTAIHELALSFKNVPFWEFGQCEFSLFSGRMQLANVVIDIREFP